METRRAHALLPYVPLPAPASATAIFAIGLASAIERSFEPTLQRFHAHHKGNAALVSRAARAGEQVACFELRYEARLRDEVFGVGSARLLLRAWFRTLDLLRERRRPRP